MTMASIGTTYWWHTDRPLYKFGYGLSYTSFEFNWSDDSASRPRSLSQAHSTRERLLSLPIEAPHRGLKSSVGAFAVNHSVTVTNTGAMTSDVVVLAFVVATAHSPPEMPLRKLFGFERFVAMAPGEAAWNDASPELQPSSHHVYPITSVGCALPTR